MKTAVDNPLLRRKTTRVYMIRQLTEKSSNPHLDMISSVESSLERTSDSYSLEELEAEINEELRRANFDQESRITKRSVSNLSKVGLPK